MKNEYGEVIYTTYPGWKRAVKKAYHNAIFTGDKDIDGASANFTDKRRWIGEWNGAEGVICNFFARYGIKQRDLILDDKA